MLLDYEGLDDGPQARQRKCAGESNCHEIPVVSDPNAKRFSPLCFHHAFIAALMHDEQAQRLALGWAMAEGLKTARGVEV
jgi:hypothetical protein